MAPPEARAGGSPSGAAGATQLARLLGPAEVRLRSAVEAAPRAGLPFPRAPLMAQIAWLKMAVSKGPRAAGWIGATWSTGRSTLSGACYSRGTRCRN
eukprot:14889229-Alexandrium_andersonii.AAC.1